jgi:LuxR family transcriptional regulator, maltose regulon positive regulatory protein
MNETRAAFHHYTAPPTFRVALAERARLLETLRAAGERRVVLVDAPAGYGKTWLLGRWYAELRAAGVRVAWLGVEQADAAQFLSLTVAGLARAGIDVGRLEALAAQGFSDVPVPAAIRALSTALAPVGLPVVVFVDDLHRLPREVIHDVLARLLVELPPAVRFVISGRDCSLLPRAALRARGELFEIDTEQLRFGTEEARELLPDLAPEALGRLLARTEGWPVALQLARLWLAAKPERSSLLDAFSGRTSEVAEYLTEQVLADLPPDLQQVLADVAILEALNPELVAAVTGSHDAWRRLLEEGRLEHFLVPLDQERYWFRLHHLLLDFLRARHRERGGDLRALHARAVAWFERHGELHEAVRHAVLADDVPRAAALVERTGGWEMVLFGGAVRMRALLGVLPAGRLAEFPRVQLFQAFVITKDGELARGLRLYQQVAAAHGGTADPALARDLLVVGHLIGRYADRPVAAGELDALYREIDALPATDDAARAALLNTACLLALGTGDMPATLAACTRAAREMRRIGSVLGLNYCLLHLGLTQLHLGERREAEATLTEAAAMAEENFGADSGLKAIADVHLALALHARGEVAAAAARLDGSLRQVEAADGWVDLYAEGYGVAIANALARGEPALAADLVERMQRTATARGLLRLERLAQAFRARLALGSAAPPGTAGAARLALAADDAAGWQPGRWRDTPSAWREHQAFGLVRVLAALLDHRPADALAVLDDLESAARAGERRRDLRRLAALRAAAHFARAGGTAPVGAFVDELEAAVREDDTQFLVDLGPVLLPLLQKAWSWSREQGTSSRGRHVLATAVTALVRAAEELDAPGVLSARELEVLVELASGAPNKVIARNLNMTENTVKFHLKNVFQKLRVRHRAEALQAARGRGLLP